MLLHKMRIRSIALSRMTGMLAILLLSARLLSALPLMAGEPDPDAQVAGEFLPPTQTRDWQSIVLHHSATSAGSVAAIDAVHRKQKDSAGNPWLGIGYHFVVGNGRDMADGEIQPTFRWQQQLSGAHAGNRHSNERGIGICLIGNFENERPTDKQLVSLSHLLKTLCTRHDIPRERVLRHQDVQATLCPGRLFPWQQVLAEIPQAPGS